MKQYLSLKPLFTIFLLLSSLSISFGQELSDEQGNTILLMDGDEAGSIELFVDPIHFDCTCDDVISHLLFLSEEKTVNEQLVYISEDGYIQLDIQDDYYIVKANMELGCCAIRPGTYTANPSRWDIETEEEGDTISAP